MDTRFRLEDLLSDVEQAKEFCASVKSHGYGVISVPKEYTDVYERVFDLMSKWYGKPIKGNRSRQNIRFTYRAFSIYSI